MITQLLSSKLVHYTYNLMRKIVTGNITVYLFVCILCFSLFIGGCGYKPFPTLREDIKNLYIPTFKNSTWEPGISAVVTDSLRHEFLLDGTFQLTNKAGAHAILTGEVTEYERLPLLYDEEDNIAGERITIKATISFTSCATGEKLWEGEFGGSDLFEILLNSGIIN